jgi:hypothetical protein
MSALESLDRAEAALTAAETARNQLADLADQLDSKADSLRDRHAATTAQIGELAVDVALGTGDAARVEALRCEASQIVRELEETERTINAVQRRQTAAEKTLSRAKYDLETAVAVVAKPIATDLRARVRQAFREFCRLQALWRNATHAAREPTTGTSAVQHGIDGEPESLSNIAREYGVTLRTFELSGESRPLTSDELRAGYAALTADQDDGLFADDDFINS